MASTTSNIEKVKSLRAFAATMRDATSNWAKQYGDARYDKKGFGFSVRTDTSWNAFTVPALAFEAYVGVYGNSSVGRGWQADQTLINAYFVRALNEHKQAIFDSMAGMARADADALKEAASAELDALRKLLDSATAEQVSA